MLNWESRVFLIPNCEGRKQQSHGSMGNPPVPKERTSILAKRRTLEKPQSFRGFHLSLLCWMEMGSFEKRVQQGCLLSPCLYAEHMIRNPGLDELQAGIKIATRRISNHRYADDITQMISLNGEEELKNLLMRVKEENEKAG